MISYKSISFKLAILASITFLIIPNITMILAIIPAKTTLAENPNLPVDSLIWTTTEVISTDSTGTSYTPSLASESDGTVHIAWSDNTNYDGSGSDYDIFYKKYVPGTGWSITEVVSTESTSGSFDPSIAIGLDGIVHIAWIDSTNYHYSGIDYDVFYKRWVFETGWTTTEVVSTESIDNSENPSIAIGSDGTVHVTWQDYTDYGGSGSDCDIFYKKYMNGVGWTTTEAVSTESTSNSYAPSLAVGSDGTVHITWEDETNYGSSGTDKDILYKKWVMSAGWSTTEVVSTESTGASYRSSLDVRLDGSVHISWTDTTDYDGAGSDNDIFYRSWKLDKGWSTTEVVSTESTGSSFFSSLAIDPEGTVHITWQDSTDYDGSGFDYDIFYKRLVCSNGWTPTEVISTESTSGSYLPCLAVCSDGIIHIAWYDNTNYGGSGADQDIFFKSGKKDYSWTETIYIRVDGRIDPDTAPISTVDQITYTLTNNIVGIVPHSSAIAIERDNIIVDGAGYTLKSLAGAGYGVNVTGRTSVKVTNIRFEEYSIGIILNESNNCIVCSNNFPHYIDDYAIRLVDSSNNAISENTIYDIVDGYGIGLYNSFSNTISGNNVEGGVVNGGGITLQFSSNNTISGNTILYGCEQGLHLRESENNTIIENNIVNNNIGIELDYSLSNSIYHNNFANNTEQVSIVSEFSYWDNGYPSGGNYWSDYDIRYPTAEEMDDSGIWNTPYNIDENNQDNYPLMVPWQPPVNFVWGTTQVVSTESTGWSSIPSLAVGLDGTVHIAWSDNTNYGGSGSDEDIFYKKYVPGTGWSITEVVSTESSKGSLYPSLDLGPNGEIHIAWVDFTPYYGGSGTDWDIFYKRWTLESGWTTTEVVSTSDRYSDSPSLVVDADGKVHIAWQEAYVNSPSCIFYRRWSPCIGWSTVEMVADGTSNSIDPSLAVDSDGNIRIVWADNTDYGGSGTDYDIFHKMRSEEMGWIGFHEISRSAVDSFSPSLAVGPEGTLHVAWIEQNIFYSKNTIAGWKAAEMIPLVSSSSPMTLSLAVGSDGLVHLAWNDESSYGGSGNDSDVFYQRRSLVSGWTTTEVVSTESTEDSVYPVMAVDLDGSVHIAWYDWTNYDNCGTDQDIFYKKIEKRDQSKEDYYLVVRGSDNRIYYRTYDGSWGDWKVVPSGTTCDSPAAVVYDDKLYMVVRGINGNNLYFGNVNLVDDSFSGWSYITGSTLSKPILTCFESYDSLVLVVRGTDNKVYTCLYDVSSGTWNGWNQISTGSTNAAPAAVKIGNYVYIVVKGMDNGLYHGRLTVLSNVFSGWSWVGGSTPSDPVVTNYDKSKLYLVVRGWNNIIYYNTYNGISWSGYTSIPQATTSYQAYGPAASLTTEDQLNIVVLSSNGHLYHGTYDLNTEAWEPWSQLSGSTPCGPTLTN
jgi:parallel beta-helix repeat protein